MANLIEQDLKEINKVTNLITEGSKSAIHFGYIDNDKDQDGNIVKGNHLERIEKGPVKGISPAWTRYEK